MPHHYSSLVGCVTVALGVVLSMFCQPGRQETANQQTLYIKTGLTTQEKSTANGAQQTNKAKLETKVDAAVETARREVKMLDDIYKTSIVLITQHYVHTDKDLPAGEAFKLLFESVSEKGWHDVRLMDASGEPLNDENIPKKGFERDAVKEILAGKASVDKIVTVDGKRYLLAATAIPVVMEKCIMCHDNYADLPKGKAIGAMSYKIPIYDPKPAAKK